MNKPLFLDQTKLTRRLRPIASRKKASIIVGSGKELWDFSSNDYLGFTDAQELKKAAISVIQEHGIGSGASRLLSGDYSIFHYLEEKIASLQNKKAGLIFNAGYQANLGIISTLFGRGDVIFADKLIHASIIDGIKLSGAKLFRYSHNDLEHLEKLLKNNRQKFKEALIVTEAVFSMDGDKAPVKALSIIKQKHNCLLMVDEAHSIGIFGENGAGLVEEEQAFDNVDLIFGTFGKALGSFGAWLATSSEIKNYLINYCRSFIYTTALPPAIVASNIESLNLLQKEPNRRKDLLNKAQLAREKLANNGYETPSQSQIIPIVLGTKEKADRVAINLQEKGFRILAINPPTVPEGGSRIRLTLSYNHPDSVIEELINTIIDLKLNNNDL